MFRSALKATAGYAFAVFVCVGIMVPVMKLWRVDLHIPFCYYWDGLFEGVWIKSVIDTGWYLQNPYLGVPGSLDFRDWPMGHDNLHFFIVKLLAQFTSDFGLICNLYALLTFPLTTVCSLFVFRRWSVSFGPALAGSLLFTFLPYHFFRLQVGHLFVAGYFLVPLMIMVLLWVYQDQILSRPVDPEAKTRPRLWKGNLLAGIAICLLVSAGGVYYAFFACFFLAIAGVTAAIYRRAVYPCVAAGLLLGAIVLGGIANLSPTILHRYREGFNSEALVRCTQGAEIHGMKIVQLLLPMTNHRLGPLAALKDKYNSPPEPVITDNDWSSLGIWASLGFLFLLGYFLLRVPSGAEPSKLYWLSQLSVCGVLFATIGGFGSLFSLTVSDLIRSYTRMSVFLAFFSLFPVVLLMEKIRTQFTGGFRARLVWTGILAGMIALGILDQTNEQSAPTYEAIYSCVADYPKDYENDRAFVQAIEASVPAESWIYELPYMPFPEARPPCKLFFYDLCRGYLHSRTLRWSHGSMKGGGANAWQRELADRPIAEQVRTVTLAGFAGIYLDRAGFADHGAAIESQLRDLLGVKPLVSPNERQVFYQLASYRDHLKRHYRDEEWQAATDEARHPIFVTWPNGFFGPEGSGVDSWRWSSGKGSLVLENTAPRPRTVRLEMALQSARTTPTELKVVLSQGLQIAARSPDRAYTDVHIDGNVRPWSQEITLPPGRHEIRFICKAKGIKPHNDPRKLVFRILKFSIRDLDEHLASYRVTRR
jgi:phosphoglycerol transferase